MDFLAQHFYQFIQTSWAPFLLALHSLLTSFLLPNSHDTFLLSANIAKPEWSLLFVLVSAVGSVLGGSISYTIGRYGARPLVERFVSAQVIDKAEAKFQRHDKWAVAIGGFTPVPYKFVAFCAGMFEMNYLLFAVTSFLSRGARFLAISAILYWAGPQIKNYLIGYLNIFSMFLFVMGLALYFIYKISKHHTANGNPELY